MPGGRRGLVAPQNTFLENIIRRCSQQRKWNKTFEKIMKKGIQKFTSDPLNDWLEEKLPNYELAVGQFQIV